MGQKITSRFEMRIRRAKESDWNAIIEVLRSANFHHIGGPEMREFPIECCFVAETDGRVVGVGGYRVLGKHEGKTTLLAVLPAHRGTRIAEELQRTRLEYMLFARNVTRVYTNSDDQRVIRWCCQRFGYRRTGILTKKEEPFGRLDVHEWTELVLEKRNYKKSIP